MDVSIFTKVDYIAHDVLLPAFSFNLSHRHGHMEEKNDIIISSGVIELL